MFLEKPYWGHCVSEHLDVSGRMVSNFLSFSCHLLVKVWLNSPHFWCDTRPLPWGRGSLQKSGCAGLELWSRGGPHHSEHDGGYREARCLHIRRPVTFWPACPTRPRWPRLYYQGTAWKCPWNWKQNKQLRLGKQLTWWTHLGPV